MGKLLYIISAGHSGSTLTDMAIGSINGVFSAGEMVHLPWQIQRGPNADDQQTFCSCTKDFSNCTMWSKIIAGLNDKIGINIYSYPERFNISIHRPMNYFKKSKINGIIKLIWAYKITRWIFPILSFLFRKSIRNNWMLIDEICEKSGDEYVVDSSKNVPRFLFLRQMRPKDVHLIVLIRGVHGVASSSHFGLTDDMICKRARAWLKLYNKQVFPIIDKMKTDKYKLVHYENLCESPDKVLDEVHSFLGLSGTRKSIIDTNNYHLIAGNPIRHTGKITIRKDVRWKERLTTDQITFLNQIDANLHTIFK